MKFLILCSCLLFCTFGFQVDAWGQKGKNETPEEQAEQGSNRFRTSLDLTVEQRAQMKTCPIHGIHMHLNRNYKANSDTIRQLADYPFAEQFQFRRYCRKCSRALHKEVKQFEKEEKIANRQSAGTFERCVVHNVPMKPNPDYSSMNTVKDEDTNDKYPNARQYRHRIYCPLCTKAMKKDDGPDPNDPDTPDPAENEE